MNAAEDAKLRQVLCERLTLGASPERLHAELRQRLDEDAARALLADVIGEIGARRKAGDFAGAANRLRKKWFGGRYLAWKIFAGVLLVVGVGTTINQTAKTGTLYISFIPLVVGLVIFAAIDATVRQKSLTAEQAVDRLFERAAD